MRGLKQVATYPRTLLGLRRRRTVPVVDNQANQGNGDNEDNQCNDTFISVGHRITTVGLCITTAEFIDMVGLRITTVEFVDMVDLCITTVHFGKKEELEVGSKSWSGRL